MISIHDLHRFAKGLIADPTEYDRILTLYKTDDVAWQLVNCLAALDERKWTIGEITTPAPSKQSSKISLGPTASLAADVAAPPILHHELGFDIRIERESDAIVVVGTIEREWASEDDFVIVELHSAKDGSSMSGWALVLRPNDEKTLVFRGRLISFGDPTELVFRLAQPADWAPNSAITWPPDVNLPGTTFDDQIGGSS